jgi:predicted TIM-barrel fold metal-dependent hydrolase
MEPYWALAEELDIPVGLHTGLAPPGTPYQCCPKFRNSLGNPALLEEVLIRHPKLRVYLMHAGYPYLQETIAIMHMYPQVHADLAAIDWLRPREEFHEYLRALVRAGFGKRLMFGSDQMIWPEGIGMAIEGIESARFLTEDQKRDIFYNNAVRFLRLDEKKLVGGSSK